MIRFVVLHQSFTMVSHNHNQRSIGLPFFCEIFPQSPQLQIDVGDSCIVGLVREGGSKQSGPRIIGTVRIIEMNPAKERSRTFLLLSPAERRIQHGLPRAMPMIGGMTGRRCGQIIIIFLETTIQSKF